MSDLIPNLREALDRFESVWAGAEAGTELSRRQLIEANEALGLLRRRIDAAHVQVAAGIAWESRSELGPESLAKQQGYRTPASLIAATTGASTGDAGRLVKVGEATAPRTNLVGEVLPSRYPVVEEALRSGAVTAAVAAAVIGLLDRARLKVDDSRVAEAERLLVQQAEGLSHDDVRRLLTRAEAWLDPDGVVPREEELRGRRSLTMFERDGMLHLHAQLDAEGGASVRAAIHGFVSAEFAAREERRAPGDPDADRRPVAMIQADALVAIASHAVGCDNGGLPLNGATVIVRVSLDDLTTGAGYATIDGTDQPVSIATVRRMAASGGIIPWVCGAESEILDWGREKRLFTRAQRRALVERDGGCAMCGLPPEMTKAHHVQWWQRDAGPTDLDNGLLLCETCHHHIHDVGWEIRIEGHGISAKVWFIPPPHVDPRQRPRLGGRARYDIIA